MVVLFMVAYLLVLVVANLWPKLKKRKPVRTSLRAKVRSTTYTQYHTKKEFMAAMEAERQQWLNELRSIFAEIEAPVIAVQKKPEEKILTVKSTRILDRSGKEYLTIGEILAVLV